MDVITYARPRTIGDLVVVEYDQNYCRERVTLLAGATYLQFSLLAALAGAGGVTQAAKTGNVGNGVLSGVTADANAIEGDYKVVIIEPATNGGTFQVTRPNGQVDGEGSVGAAYNGADSVNFTLGDGATDFAAGDEFTINVSYSTDPRYAPWNPTGTDGSQFVAAVALAPQLGAADGINDLADVLVRGPVIIRKEEIAWPPGVTDAQKSAAYRSLSRAGIVPKMSG